MIAYFQESVLSSRSSMYITRNINNFYSVIRNRGVFMNILWCFFVQHSSFNNINRDLGAQYFCEIFRHGLRDLVQCSPKTDNVILRISIPVGMLCAQFDLHSMTLTFWRTVWVLEWSSRQPLVDRSAARSMPGGKMEICSVIMVKCQFNGVNTSLMPRICKQ